MICIPQLLWEYFSEIYDIILTHLILLPSMQVPSSNIINRQRRSILGPQDGHSSILSPNWMPFRPGRVIFQQGWMVGVILDKHNTSLCNIIKINIKASKDHPKKSAKQTCPQFLPHFSTPFNHIFYHLIRCGTESRSPAPLDTSILAPVSRVIAWRWWGWLMCKKPGDSLIGSWFDPFPKANCRTGHPKEHSQKHPKNSVWHLRKLKSTKLSCHILGFFEALQPITHEGTLIDSPPLPMIMPCWRKLGENRSFR